MQLSGKWTPTLTDERKQISSSVANRSNPAGLSTNEVVLFVQVNNTVGGVVLVPTVGVVNPASPVGVVVLILPVVVVNLTSPAGVVGELQLSV